MTTNYIPIANRLGIVDLGGVYVAGALGSGWQGTTNSLPSVTTEDMLGEIVGAYSITANAAATGDGGYGEFQFLAVPTSTAITAGLLYSFNAGTYQVVVVPTSLGTQGVSGFPVAIAINAVTSNTTSVQYTWFQVGGRCTALKTAVAVVGSIPIYTSGTTAGRIKVLGSAFRAIIGARTANTASVTSTTSTVAVYLNRPNITSGI